MVTMEHAKRIVIENLGWGTEITAAIEYGDEFMFIAIRPDPLEGYCDPFFKVHRRTGASTDFSPQDYPKPREIIDALLAQTKKT